MAAVLRAALVAALAVVGAVSHAHAAEPGVVAFDIYMNGARVGRHEVAVTQEGERAVARVRIDMAGRVGPFSFTYAHRCTETARAARVETLACEDREGRRVRTVTARASGEALQVLVDGRASSASAGLLPATWWRVQTVGAPQLLDTRNGRVLPVRIAALGTETVATPSGPRPATRYHLEGSTRADLWYDSEGHWVKMAFRLRGQSFDYRLATDPSAAPKG